MTPTFLTLNFTTGHTSHFIPADAAIYQPTPDTSQVQTGGNVTI